MSDEIKWMVFSKMIVRCKTSLQYAVLEVNIWEARGMQSANYAPSWSNETWRPTRRGQPGTCVNTTQLFPSYHQFRTSGSAALININVMNYSARCWDAGGYCVTADCRAPSASLQPWRAQPPPPLSLNFFMYLQKPPLYLMTYIFTLALGLDSWGHVYLQWYNTQYIMTYM